MQRNTSRANYINLFYVYSIVIEHQKIPDTLFIYTKYTDTHVEV